FYPPPATSSPAKMLLRIRGPDAMVRVEVDRDDTFGDLGRQLLPKLPDTVDPQTITLSNAPSGGDSKKLVEIAHIKVGQIGLKHGDIIFVNYKHQERLANGDAGAGATPSSGNRLNGKPVTDPNPRGNPAPASSSVT